MNAEAGPTFRLYCLQRLPAPAVSHSARTCGVSGCRQTTRERKPWCTAHLVRHSPYARDVQRKWRDRENDKRRKYIIRGDSLLLSDARAALLTEPVMSVAKLARMLLVHSTLAQRIAEALEAQGYVALGESNRGGVTMELSQGDL